MNKYWQIFRTTVSEYLVYRLSFVLWRVRVFLGLLIVYFLWETVFSNNNAIFGYTKSEMLTYVLLTQVANGIIMSGRTQDIADYILNGDIINYLLKPFSLLHFSLTREVADKLINTFFSILEIGVMILVFKPVIYWPTNGINYLLFVISLFIGIILNFFLSLLISFTAFWTSETWASRFIFTTAVFALNGGYFPLDVFPKTVYNLFLMTPFPYLLYVPCKIYLTGLTAETLTMLLMGSFWAIVFYFIARHTWRAGLKSYAFFGR